MKMHIAKLTELTATPFKADGTDAFARMETRPSIQTGGAAVSCYCRKNNAKSMNTSQTTKRNDAQTICALFIYVTFHGFDLLVYII